ncbi:MAG: hypothetical protein KDA61_12820 [Planctomycetales bacterium]|nr:hypothetical protein [Planctomycetales bacterium]
MERFRTDYIRRRVCAAALACAAWSAVYASAAPPIDEPIVDARPRVADVDVSEISDAVPALSDEFGANGDAIASGQASREKRHDEVYLISTRRLGTLCRPERMADGLQCERLEMDGGRAQWRTAAWRDVLQQLEKPLPKIVYVHGNRVSRGVDRRHGMLVYRRLPERGPDDLPRQYVIWSWPSDRIRGPLKDYRKKAEMTPEVGWQLGWMLRQLPPDAPTALVGYSYGASVVASSLHLMAGGRVGNLRLAPQEQGGDAGEESVEIVDRVPRHFHVALVAAACDADWIGQGAHLGRAPQLVDRMFLLNNRLDPAMRFYHLSTPGRSTRAMGYEGPLGLAMRGRQASQVMALDMTDKVGRSHALEQYLAAAPQLGQFLAHFADRHSQDDNELAASKPTSSSVSQRNMARRQ